MNFKSQNVDLQYWNFFLSFTSLFYLYSDVCMYVDCGCMNVNAISRDLHNCENLNAGTKRTFHKLDQHHYFNFNQKFKNIMKNVIIDRKKAVFRINQNTCC